MYRLKLKRPQTAKMYRGELDRMYAEVNAATPEVGIMGGKQRAKL